jgi:hypothetical protein
MEKTKKTVYDLLNGMMQSPELSIMLKSGIIPATVLARFDYYRSYLKYKGEGKGSTTAAQLAADDFKLSLTTVYNAKAFFERPLEEI